MALSTVKLHYAYADYLAWKEKVPGKSGGHILSVFMNETEKNRNVNTVVDPDISVICGRSIDIALYDRITGDKYDKFRNNEYRYATVSH